MYATCNTWSSKAGLPGVMKSREYGNIRTRFREAYYSFCIFFFHFIHCRVVLQEAIALLDPLTNDSVNFVRQGALIASAMILIQQTEGLCPKVRIFW